MDHSFVPEEVHHARSCMPLEFSLEIVNNIMRSLLCEGVMILGTTGFVSLRAFK